MPTPATTFNVIDYGADPTGSAYSTTAFGNAISAAESAVGGQGGVVLVPPGIYKIASGLTFPRQVSLEGQNFQPANPGGGSVMLFDLGVMTCVTLGGVGSSGADGAASIRQIVITRAAGTIPVGSVGLLVKDLYAPIIEDVLSSRHYQCVNCFAESVYGISYHFQRLFTSAATDAHMVIDGVPEVYAGDCRFGANGSGDQPCGTYLRFTNTAGASGSVGPNTLIFERCHFNQGSNTTNQWIQFSVDGPGEHSSEFHFTDCHVEAVASVYLYSDYTWSIINRLVLTACTFNAVIPFFGLSSSTSINDWNFTGNQFYCNGFTLAPSAQINALTLVNNRMANCGPTITAASNSTIICSANMWGGNFTLSGSGVLFKSMDLFLSGSFLNHTTGSSVLVY